MDAAIFVTLKSLSRWRLNILLNSHERFNNFEHKSHDLKMADDTKNLVALLNGITKRSYFEGEELTNDFLKSELYPDLPDEEFTTLVAKCTSLLKVNYRINTSFQPHPLFKILNHGSTFMVLTVCKYLVNIWTHSFFISKWAQLYFCFILLNRMSCFAIYRRPC